MLAIFDAEDKKITFDGRSAVSADPTGKDFPWLPKALSELTEDTAGSINSKASLVYFTGQYAKLMDSLSVIVGHFHSI